MSLDWRIIYIVVTMVVGVVWSFNVDLDKRDERDFRCDDYYNHDRCEEHKDLRHICDINFKKAYEYGLRNCKRTCEHCTTLEIAKNLCADDVGVDCQNQKEKGACGTDTSNSYVGPSLCRKTCNFC